MKMFYSGKFIGDVRNAQNIKLAELVQGLCSTAQLARIESGVRSAEKLLFDSLYERLGKNTERFTAYDFQTISLYHRNLIYDFLHLSED